VVVSGSEIVFYLLSAVAVLMAAGVVFARSPVHSALFLVISFLNVAGIFVLLGAEFLAAVQVIVYTGAILVVFLFVIMLVRPEDLGELRQGSRVQTSVAWILGIGLFLEIATVIGTGIVRGQQGQVTPQQVAAVGGNTQALGRFLYSEYLLPFEVASLVLLVAVIAAVLLGVPDRVLNYAERRTTRTISLGHPTGTDRIAEADRLGIPAVDAPDLVAPGARDVDRVSAGGGRTRVTTIGRD
jgi:NADH-quinone oxidoreductase subunit J